MFDSLTLELVDCCGWMLPFIIFSFPSSPFVKDYELEFKWFSQNSLLMSSYKGCVVSLGGTLRMTVRFKFKCNNRNNL